jgi:CheY-like chemotaxis protein
MTEEVRNRIFQPFFTTKRRGKGTGLGLSTVHGIVTQNDGDLHVESAPDQGTRIRVRWPQADPIDAVELSGAARGRPEGGSETILLAEDDDALRGLAVRILERAGYRVLAAESGGCALETSDGYEGTVDLLLTDIVMPGISGIDLAERVRESRPETPVLFMSGYLDEQLHGDGRMDPSSDLLLKPFHGPELLDRIRKRLEHSSPEDTATPR